MRDQVGKRVRELRKARGLTQAKVAETAGVNLNYFAALERTGANLTIDTLVKVADALGVRVIDLFRFQERAEDDGQAVVARVRQIVEEGRANDIRRLRVFLEQIL